MADKKVDAPPEFHHLERSVKDFLSSSTLADVGLRNPDTGGITR